ncbi:predicted protein [Thalassiosira pseudonana CCMP1335]|uniref:Uncharacterized protein n=1 Tax=Thalassiosira pseudonana TaxID=35128 RepID=B8LC88_THAPS|nr:predicted protein [Thalassiosira pseudonana CCMP1335]EED87052.1 predicted protein [Thalassiosira pseudonana CCMP1335]|eukprot:g5240.t1 g5240   contig2:67332-67853(+)
MSQHILSLVSSRIHPVHKLDDHTWSDVLNEVRYHSEHAVRYYYFCTHRSITVDIAAILNAIELLRREYRAVLLTALLIVLQEFDFAETSELVAAKNKLLHDVEEMGVAANEDGGITDISADVAQVAVCDGDVIASQEYHRSDTNELSTALVMDTSSPRTIFCDEAHQRYNSTR